MTPTHIDVVCQNGHTQVVKVAPKLSLEWALGLAKMLDGTSPMYATPPGPESPIGKCGVCGSRITATVRGR